VCFVFFACFWLAISVLLGIELNASAKQEKHFALLEKALKLEAWSTEDND